MHFRNYTLLTRKTGNIFPILIRYRFQVGMCTEGHMKLCLQFSFKVFLVQNRYIFKISFFLCNIYIFSELLVQSMYSVAQYIAYYHEPNQANPQGPALPPTSPNNTILIFKPYTRERGEFIQGYTQRMRLKHIMTILGLN